MQEGVHSWLVLDESRIGPFKVTVKAVGWSRGPDQILRKWKEDESESENENENVNVKETGYMEGTAVSAKREEAENESETRGLGLKAKEWRAGSWTERKGEVEIKRDIQGRKANQVEESRCKDPTTKREDEKKTERRAVETHLME